MQITAQVKAVGKYKEKFNSTGILLLWNGETWVDLPGQLNWKDYKDKTLTFEVQQNDKGYWSGTIANTFQQPPVPQPPQNAPQPTTAAPSKDLLIIRQSSLEAAVELLKGTDGFGPTEAMKIAEIFTEYVFKGPLDMGRRIDDLV